ncbi:MAG TPA: flagellin, partial [Campylobacterales bacterium]|nr:flagellin [Campylobacterales bacterium]
MRVGTFTMYYNFNKNQETSMRQLNTVNSQMASNTKIEYGYQDTNIFIDTLRLDKEAYTLAQNTKGAETARQFAATTDTTMNDMVTALTDFKTKLVG